MYISHLNGRALHLLERKTRRAGVAVLPPESKRKGVLVHSEASVEAMAMAVYDVTDGRLTVDSFQAREFSLEIGRMLVEALREAASESQVGSIWLISPVPAVARDFLASCGFSFMAFCRADPVDRQALCTEYWKLV